MSAKRIVLLGPPGAGKGTQAKELCDALKVAHLATGDLLRSAVANNTPVGEHAKSYMSQGKLVPDQVVIDVLIEAIEGPRNCKNGYVLDGFPRTIRQAEALKKVLQKRREKIDRVILIDTPDDVIRERLSQRRSCPDPLCGAVYNLKSKLPKVDNVCDICKKALIIRNDDKPETILVRQQQYWHDTMPLIDYYERAGLLVRVPGGGALDEVGELIIAAAKSAKVVKSRRGDRE